MAVALHPHLEGTLAPVRSEDDFELRVSGRIPAGLEGAFYRNGPNPQLDPTGPYHVFLGDGMHTVNFVLMMLAVVITVVSGAEYLWQAWKGRPSARTPSAVE